MENFMEENQNPMQPEAQAMFSPSPLNGYFMNADPTYQESKSIKKWGNLIGFTIVGFFVIQIIPALLLTNYNFYQFYIKNEIAKQSLGILFYILCAFTPFLILSFTSLRSGTELMPLGKIKLSLFTPLVLIGVLAFLIGDIATNQLVVNMDLFGITLKSPEHDDIESLWGFLLSVISTAVLPALIEEFSMRGVVLQSLRKFGDGFAVIMSAFLFAVMHGNFVQAPFAFIGGLAFGYITVKTGSLWASITIHFVNNLMAVVFEAVNLHASKQTYFLTYSIVFFLLICAGIASLILMLKKHPDFFKLNEGKTLCTFKQKITSFICTPGVITALVMVALTSAAYLEVSWF